MILWSGITNNTNNTNNTINNLISLGIFYAGAGLNFVQTSEAVKSKKDKIYFLALNYHCGCNG